MEFDIGLRRKWQHTVTTDDRLKLDLVDLEGRVDEDAR
jgi:hypothetical protein